MGSPKPLKYNENDHGCYVVISHYKNKDGYALFYRNGRQWLIHRWTYQQYYGHIPKNMYVLHKCDNPSCVNPDHLFLGTQYDNMRDSIKKGRFPNRRGEFNGNAKLTEQQAIGIKNAKGTFKQISKRYKISYQIVWRIKNRVTWVWLT